MLIVSNFRFRVGSIALTVFACGLIFGCGARGTANADEVMDALVAKQASLAARYQKLEELLLRLAEMEAAENPERSALLKRAARQSRDRFVLTKLQNATQSLGKEQLQQAVDQQESASKELAAVLKLLLTEDRSKRIRDERQKISEVVKELKRVERAQRSIRGRNENGGDEGQLGQEQDSLGKRVEDLAEELDEDDADDQDSDGGEPDEDASSDRKDNEGPKGEGQEGGGDPKESPSDQPSSDPKNSDGENPASDGKPSDPSAPSEGQPSSSPADNGPPQESQPQSGEPQQGPPSADSPQGGQQTPPSPKSPQQQAADQIQQAKDNMKKAEEALRNAKRNESVKQQRLAEQNLRGAIDQLEQILRQLREEEKKRELAKLEARLRAMAAAQSKVLDETIELAQLPILQRNRQTDLKAGDLAFEEKKITLDADRALLLLREEGSSVAFPEVILQIRDDTSRIAERLGKTKIDIVTQGIQEDVLAALEEMIEALQKERKKLEQQQQQQQQGSPNGQKQDPSLVEQIAELKLIRTMETRIKSTTERYAQLIQAGETTEVEIKPLMDGLSQRQIRLYRITRDLVTKRNK